MQEFYVYIMSNKQFGTLYVGMTDDLARRVYEHRNKLVDGFSKKYNLYRLVYFEILDDRLEALAREGKLKKWKRSWKIDLISKSNPDWNDFYNDII